MAPAIPQLYQHGATHPYLNCWYLGSDESYAMWKIYDSAGKGVAIRTTAGRLKESLIGSCRPAIFGAKVRCAGHFTETPLFLRRISFLPYIYKRSSFSHESEYRLLAMWSPEVLEVDEQNRAISHEPDLPPLFLREHVDLDRLVEAVCLSPDASDWVARVVREVTGKYMPRLDVRHSDLAADPVY